jgi:hypothetical protein
MWRYRTADVDKRRATNGYIESLSDEAKPSVLLTVAGIDEEERQAVS